VRRADARHELQVSQRRHLPLLLLRRTALQAHHLHPALGVDLRDRAEGRRPLPANPDRRHLPRPRRGADACRTGRRPQRGGAAPRLAQEEARAADRERGKLMEAHYAGAIPVDLLGQEQDRISKGLASIKTELDATNEKWEVIERNLGRALDLATDCHAAYTTAPEHIRRLFNQAFFEKILILPDDNDRVGVRLEAELAEPFDTLLTKAKRSAGDASGPLRQSSSHSSALTQSICLSKDTVVEHIGFEPMTSSMPWKRASQLRQCPVSLDIVTNQHLYF
jgi:hypothetical protein